MLIRRGKTYHFRQWIPLDLRTTFRCKELVRSLKTTDRGQAKLSARLLEHEAERLFFLVRSGMLDYEQIDYIVADFKRKTLRQLTNERREQGPLVYLPPELRLEYANADNRSSVIQKIIEHHSDLKKELTTDIQTNNFDDVTGLVKRLLSEHDIDEADNSKNFRLLCEYLLKAKIEISSSVIRRMKGDFQHSQISTPNAVAVKSHPAPKLSDLWEAYCKSKEAKGSWKPKTAQKNKDTIEEALKIMGNAVTLPH